MKNKSIKKQKKNEKEEKKAALWPLLIGAVVLAAVAVVLISPRKGYTQRGNDVMLAQTDGLRLCSVGSYTGDFVEQGKEEPAASVLSIVVENTGRQMIQKAVFTVGQARFVLTWLPPGAQCLVQEQSAMTWTRHFSGVMQAESVQTLPMEQVTLHPETVALTATDGEIVLENISGQDIPGSVRVWYKTVEDGLLFGGVSYQAGVDDGVLTADSTATIAASHYSQERSRILLVELTGS